MDPRGIRNNNPGNIEYGRFAKSWGGEPEPGSGRFAYFPSPEAGIAALFALQSIYENKHGLFDIEGRIGRWAPAGENDVNAYAIAISNAMGIPLNEAFSIARDPDKAAAFAAAMIQYENGRQPYTKDVLDRAYQIFQERGGTGGGNRGATAPNTESRTQEGRDPEYTRQVQTLLNENGAKLVVDGKWGPLTQAAWDAHEAGRARRGGLDPAFTSPMRGGGFGAGIVAPTKAAPTAASTARPATSVQRGVSAPSVGKPIAETLLGPNRISSFLDGTSIGRALNTTAPGGAPVAGYTTAGGTPWSWYTGAPDARSPYYGLDPLEYGLANNAPYRGEIISPAMPSREAPAPVASPTVSPPAAPVANNLTLRPDRPDGSTALSRSVADVLMEKQYPQIPSTDPRIAVGRGRSGILTEFPALGPSRPLSDIMRNEPSFRPSMLDRSYAAVAAPTEQAPSPLASWLTSLVSGVRPAMETVGRGIATANNAVANFAAPSAASIGNAIAAIFGGVPSSAPTPGGYVAPFNPFER